MTDEHYKHVQSLIKRELTGRIESSAWFALALAAFSAAGTVLVTIAATVIPEADNRAKLETLGWGCLAFGVFCVLVHLLFRRRSGDQKAKDIIDMMDRYNMEVERHASGVAAPALDEANGTPSRTE